MSYNNYDYEPEVLDENWEFNSALNELIEKEIEKRTEEFRDNYNNTIQTNTRLKSDLIQRDKDIREIKNQLNNLSLENKVSKDVLARLNKDNMSGLISFTYDTDFKEGYDNEIPKWFTLLVNYYCHKDEVINIFRLCGINLPSWVSSFRLPFDWTKDELDYFFKTIGNHYVCNGCIYSDNLRFWYGNDLGDPKAVMSKRNYSEIPWQFVLRHPLLNTSEYCEKMAMEINKGSNGYYFSRVVDYQTLNDENLNILINALDVSKIKGLNSNDYISSLVLKNLSLITDEAKLNVLFPMVSKVWQAEKYIEKMPKKYYIKYLKNEGKDAISTILESKTLTKSEKEELMSKIVE